MSIPGHARPGLDVQQLQDEPEAQNEHRRNFYYPKKENENNQGKYPGSGIKNYICSQYAGDRPARSYHRSNGIGINQYVHNACQRTANKIKQDETHMSHSIFYVVAKNPQIEHIAYDVQKPPMHKH